MVDIADLAGIEMLTHERAAEKRIAAERAARRVPSLDVCTTCGDDIPPERQKLGGVTECVYCAGGREPLAEVRR
jgi:RNA polymerase-binding transcription factor DksA